MMDQGATSIPKKKAAECRAHLRRRTYQQYRSIHKPEWGMITITSRQAMRGAMLQVRCVRAMYSGRILKESCRKEILMVKSLGQCSVAQIARQGLYNMNIALGHDLVSI